MPSPSTRVGPPTRTVSDHPRRWVCWPDPDRVCLQGGCSYCTPEPGTPKAEIRRKHRQMSLSDLDRYAESNGIVIATSDLLTGMLTRAVSTP